MTTYYKITGKGEPIIFIHGAFISSQMWEPQVEHFSKYYKVITYDLRGHGRTGISETGNYSVDLFADDLKKIIDEIIPGQRPIVCGLSLGGMIAQSFAVRYNENLSCLILCDTVATITPTIIHKVLLWLFPKRLLITLVKLVGVKRFIKFAYWMAGFIRGEKWFRNKEIIEYTKQEMLNQNEKEWIKTIDTIYKLKKQELKNIKVPTLIIVGENEPKTFFHNAALLLREIPRAEVKVINDTGHFPNLEKPKEFNAVVEEFLKKACP